MKHPSAVIACNLDLENLITDTNRSIATLAITTLLKVRVVYYHCTLYYTLCIILSTASTAHSILYSVLLVLSLLTHYKLCTVLSTASIISPNTSIALLICSTCYIL